MFSELSIGVLPISPVVSPVVSQVLVQVLALQIARHSNPVINHWVVQAGNLCFNPLLNLLSNPAANRQCFHQINLPDSHHVARLIIRISDHHLNRRKNQATTPLVSRLANHRVNRNYHLQPNQRCCKNPFNSLFQKFSKRSLHLSEHVMIYP